MAIETERKFKVKGDFTQYVQYSKRIIQGYICADKGRTVRVRIAGEKAYLTIKGPAGKKFWSHYEFEQEIPLTDAEDLMKLCISGIIEKVRHYIPAGDHIWEVDVFHGENEGLIIAEIELSSEDELFEQPNWLGEEVSPDSRYYNSMLSKRPYSQWKDSI